MLNFISATDCASTYPRCFPHAVTFDTSIMGVCLLNMELGRCLSTLEPSSGIETQAYLSAGIIIMKRTLHCVKNEVV